MDIIYFNRKENCFPQLSNFYNCAITYKGVIYTSVEAAYQAQKCTDPEEAATYCSMTPHEAKIQSHKIKSKREDWHDVNLGIMKDLLRIKFSSNPYCKAILLSTGNKVLVEKTTWHDTWWGICECPRCATKEQHNNLGRLLMEVRDELRNPKK